MRMLQQGAWLAWTFALFTAYFLWESLGLSHVASLIPRFVLSLALFLLLVEIVVHARASRMEGAALARDQARDQDEAPQSSQPEGPGAQAWQVFLWIAILPVAMWLFGLTAGAFVFCLLFLKWRSKESWKFSLATSIGLGVVLHLLFSWVFQSGLYQGVIQIHGFG